MTKEVWQVHRRAISNEDWLTHDKQACPDCRARRKTKNATANHRNREDAYKLAGLVKVRGALGGTYWE